MSYCRWSCDGFRSDVYCYADVSGGYTTHVARNKVAGDIPVVPPLPRTTDREVLKPWLEAHNKMMAFVAEADHEPLGLPVDGETFNDETLPEFLNRLLWLRQLGYRVPQFAIDAVQDEIINPES